MRHITPVLFEQALVLGVQGAMVTKVVGLKIEPFEVVRRFRDTK